MPAIDSTKLKRLRENKGWSQADLASAMNRNKQHVERIERLERASADSALELALALDVTVDDIRCDDVNIDRGLLNECLEKLGWKPSIFASKLTKAQRRQLHKHGTLDYEQHEQLLKEMNSALAARGYEEIETFELPYSREDKAIEFAVTWRIKIHGADIETVRNEYVSALLDKIESLAGDANPINIQADNSCLLTLEARVDAGFHLQVAITSDDLWPHKISVLFPTVSFPWHARIMRWILRKPPVDPPCVKEAWEGLKQRLRDGKKTQDPNKTITHEDVKGSR